MFEEYEAYEYREMQNEELVYCVHPTDKNMVYD
jgi:hypothetical protein